MKPLPFGMRCPKCGGIETVELMENKDGKLYVDWVRCSKCNIEFSTDEAYGEPRFSMPRLRGRLVHFASKQEELEGPFE